MISPCIALIQKFTILMEYSLKIKRLDSTRIKEPKVFAGNSSADLLKAFQFIEEDGDSQKIGATAGADIPFHKIQIHLAKYFQAVGSVGSSRFDGFRSLTAHSHKGFSPPPVKDVTVFDNSH